MVDKAVVASLHRLSGFLTSDVESRIREASTASEMQNLTACFDDVADSELEIVTPLLFDSKIGLLKFLDIRPPNVGSEAPQRAITKDVRKEGFRMLTTAVKRMARQNLLRDAEVVKELKDVCLHTLQTEEKPEVREECCEPLLLILGDDAAEDDEADKKLFSGQLYPFFTGKKSGPDSSKGVKRQRLRILGLMCEKHQERILKWEFQGQSCLDALLGVLDSQMVLCRKDKTMNTVHAGCFEALDGFFVHNHAKAAAKKGFLASVYGDIIQVVFQTASDAFSRYQLPLAVLRVLSKHASCFTGQIHDSKVSAPELCGALLKCCVKSNTDVRRAAYDALDSWLGTVRDSLGKRPRELNEMMRQFQNLTETVDARNYCLAVRGYGALAAPIGATQGEGKLSELWFQLAAYMDKILVEFGEQNSAELQSEVQQLLPDIVIALADILAEERAVSNEAMEVLTKFVLALFQSYASTMQARRFLAHRAWYYLLYVLKSKGAALHQLLDATVYPALIVSVQPSADDRCARPGVPPAPGQRPQPCMIYCDFWKSLEGDSRHSEWIRRRQQTEVPATTQDEIALQVYNRLWRAVVAIVQTLDVELEAAEESDPAEAGKAEGGAEAEDGSGEVGAVGARPQASGMTGRERPRNPRDIAVLLNLVDICRQLMRGLAPRYFEASYTDFTRAMVQGSTRNPLISGFFKLLALAMAVIDKGGWYDGFSVRQVDSMRGDGREGDDDDGSGSVAHSEALTCFVVTFKFAREVIAHSEQCFDDLLAACLEFALALPAAMLDFALQIPALRGALKMGTVYPYMAGVALDCLERWVQRGVPGLNRHLPGVLPLLELYLVRHEEADEGADRSVKTLQSKQRSAKYHLNKANAGKRKAQAVHGEAVADAKEMAMRAVRLLGKLGTQSTWLTADDGAEGAAIDPRAGLLGFEVDLGERWKGVKLPLDALLVRVMHLAESSSDRKAKVAACELLHAMVMVAVGTHASQGAREMGQTRESFIGMFRVLLPCVFRLAVDTEGVAAQLFLPLSQQIVRWFASKNAQFEPEADAVLDAVLEGVESASNGKLREASSELLALFVEWTLRGVTDEKKQEEAKMVKALIRRLQGLLNHPNVCKRLGSYFAVKQLGKFLWRHPRIVDQFLLELMGACVKSLRFTHDDHPALESEKAGASALMSLERVLFRKDKDKPDQRYLDKLCQKREGRGQLNPRRLHDDLPAFVGWLFGELGTHQKPARRYAMQLLAKLCGQLPGFSKPQDWIQKEGLPQLVDVLEHSLKPDGRAGREAESLGQLHLRSQHLLTALDGYEWLLSGAYVRPAQAFSSQSQLCAAVQDFANHAAKLPERIAAVATPSELRRHSHMKSRCLHALFKLLATLLERFPDYEPPHELLCDDVLWCLLLCLLAPADLHLDVVTDPLVAGAIPEQIAKLCVSLGKHKSHFKRLQEKLSLVEMEAPHLSLNDLDELKKSLSEDQRKLYFQALLRLVRWGLRDKDDDALAKQLLEHMMDAFTDRRSPGQIEVDEATLALSVELHGRPMQVWAAVMAPLQREGDNWRDHRCWSFYLAFRQSLDVFFSNSDDILSTALMKHIGKKDREYCSCLLHNMLETKAHDAIRDQTVGQECSMVTTLMAKPDWLDQLCMPGSIPGSFPARKKHGRDILLRMLSLSPWSHLTSAGKQKICQCIRWLLDPSSGVELLVEVMEIVPLPFNQAAEGDQSTVSAEVRGVADEVSAVLDRYFPLKSSDLMLGSDEHCNFLLIFQALMRVISACRTAAVLPLIRDHVVREDDHAYASQIADALDGFVLGMSDDEAQGVITNIITHLLDPTRPTDPVSLRVQRRVVSQIACRILRRLQPEALIAVLEAHVGSCIAVLNKKSDPASPDESNKVCMLLVLETWYGLLDYASHKDRINGAMSKEHLNNRTLTVYLIDFLDKQRQLPMHASTDGALRELSLAFHRAVHNTLVTIVRRTQSKLGFFTRYVFTNCAWEKIVDTTDTLHFAVYANFKESMDDLSVFRTKYMHSAASAALTSRSSTTGLTDGDMGSLSQSLSALPTLFGYKTSQREPRSGFVQQSAAGEDDGGGVALGEDMLNRNACMRPFLATLLRVGTLFGVAKTREADMPVWMQPLCEKINDPDVALNVRVFIAKILINHQKAAAANSTSDLFRPHAKDFFDAFFNKEHGLALLLSTPKKEDKITGLMNAFNYIVREICLLWMTWLRPQDDTAFVLRTSQAGRAWHFIHRLMEIVINREPAIAKSNVQFLSVFLEQWRSKASETDLEECVKRMTMFLKYRRKKGADGNDEKKEEELAQKTGLQLMAFFLNTEVEALNDEEAKAMPQDWEHLSNHHLHSLVVAALPLLQPATDANKANRQYTANRLLIPAAEACGLVLACGEAEKQLPGIKAKREELLELVVQRVEKIETEAKVDQLLLVLEKLAGCSPASALRLHRKVWAHVSKVHGTFLNAIQGVLIATVAQLSRPATAGEHDEAKHDLIVNLMPILPSMLSRQDARTQLFALLLLTGRDQEGQPPQGGQGGLLRMLSSSQVEGLVREVLMMLPDHRDEQVRFHFFALLEGVCALHDSAAHKMGVHRHLVRALQDASERIRREAFEWWHSKGLPADPLQRAASLLERLRMPEGKGTEEHWLGCAAWLLMQLAREQSGEQDPLFGQPLEDNASFENVTISTDFGSASLPMTPMFVSSSLPMAGSQFAGSQLQSLTQGAGGGDVLATLADDDGSSLEASQAVRYVEEQTLQQGSGFLFARAGPAAARKPRNVKQELPPSVRRGAFVTPFARGAGGGGGAGGDDKAVRQRMARLAEERKTREEQTKLARKRKVEMLRKYRKGELPDVQIQRWEVTKPMQDLLLRDSHLAKILLTSLLPTLLEGGSRPVDAKLREEVEDNVVAMLHSASVTSPDMVDALLEVAIATDIRLPADAVSAASQRTASFFSGIAALERQIRSQPKAQTAKPPRALSSPTPSRPTKRKSSAAVSPAGAQGGRRGEGGVTEDDWMELSRLYQRLGEEDIVRGLYEKFSCQPATTEALQLELRGKFDVASELYKELTVKDWKVQEGEEEWENGREPQDLEVELWTNGQVECLMRSHRWRDLMALLEGYMTQSGDGDARLKLDDALWTEENRRYLPIYLRSLIGKCSQSGDHKDRREFVELIEECWYADEGSTKKAVLQQELLHETALGLLLSPKANRQWARELVRVGLDRFLEEWGASSEVGAVARKSKLRSLQRLVEVEESLPAMQDIGRAPALLAVWDRRLPSVHQVGDAEEWDMILSSRLTLLRRMLEGRESKGAVKEGIEAAIRKTYLAMGGMARRQGSLSVATKCQDLAESVRGSQEWQLRCLSSRVKLELALCAEMKDDAEVGAAVERMRKLVASVAEGGKEGMAVVKARVKLHALSAQVNCVGLRASKESEREKLRGEAMGQYKEAITKAKKARVRAGDEEFGRIEHKLHLRLAIFCDQQVRALEQAGGSSKTAGELASVYMEEMLEAMREGGGPASEHLPRCLQLLAEGPEGSLRKLQQIFATKAPSLPAASVLRWLPQLLSHLSRDRGGAEGVAGLLSRVAKEHPQAVFFASRVVQDELSGQEARMRELRASWQSIESTLEDFCDGVRLLQHPEDQVGDLLDAMTTDTASEQMLQDMYRDFVSDVGRQGQYREGFARKLTKSAADLVALVKKTITSKAMAKKGHSFKDDAALKKCREKASAFVAEHKTAIKPGKLPLSHLAPELANFEGHSDGEGALVIPGQQVSAGAEGRERAMVQVVSMDPTLLTLPSKARPKRLKMRGSDGKEYWWLAKAGEDLRQDERVQQVLHSMNQVLAADPYCAQRRLTLKTYAVVPVSKQVGVLEWVQDTRPLEELIKPPALPKFNEANKQYKSIYQAVPDYQAALQKSCNPKAMKAFANVQQILPPDVLRNSLMANAATPQAELTIRGNYAQSLAALSTAHYILGIGDRHTGNTLVSNKEGLLVGIDFGHAFGSATQLLPVPELMPFRLTRQMVGVLSPLDAEGLLKRSMTYVMAALRANKDVLKQTMEIFISDPTVDWLHNARKQARNQGVDDPLNWAIQNKVAVLDMKLRGDHPGIVMAEELSASTHSWIRKSAQDKGPIHQLVFGKQGGERRALLQKAGKGKGLSASDQVAALVSQAADPLILGHTWIGWSPFA